MEDMNALPTGQSELVSLLEYSSQSIGSKAFANSHIKISRLEARHEIEIIKIIKDNLAPFKEAGTVLASAFRRLERFHEVYRSERAEYVGVIDTRASNVIGGAGIGPFAGLSPDEKIGEMRELVIVPEYRGQGIGRILLQSSLNVAKKLGYKRLYLETTPQMIHAQYLFRRFGFIPVTQKQDRNGNEVKTEGLPCYYVLEHL